MKKQLSAKRIKKLSRRLTEVLYYESIDSTNTEAKRLIKESDYQNALVISSHQTAGRGRWDRSFYSPKDSGLYFSLILKPSESAEKLPLITVATAVAVCKALDELGVDNSLIKWVNDIYLNDRKCVGILAESVFQGGEKPCVVVGIGINLTSDFPDEIKDKAGNVGEVDKERLVALICDKLIEYSDNLGEKNFMDEYKKRCFLLDNEVFVYDNSSGVRYRAIAKTIDEEGRLVVEKNGEIITLSSEEVSVKSNDKQ